MDRVDTVFYQWYILRGFLVGTLELRQICEDTLMFHEFEVGETFHVSRVENWFMLLLGIEALTCRFALDLRGAVIVVTSNLIR
jgi:hypothetical protein